MDRPNDERDCSATAAGTTAAEYRFGPFSPERTADYLYANHDGAVEKHGLVASLRREGAFVWCYGFPHLFARYTDLDHACSSRDLAPFDVVKLRLVYVATPPSCIRVSRIEVVDNQIVVNEVNRVYSHVEQASAIVERIDPSDRHCTLVRVDDSSHRIFMNLSAFPCAVAKLSDHLTQGSKISVAFVESFAYQRYRLLRFYALALLPGDWTPEKLQRRGSHARTVIFREFMQSFSLPGRYKHPEGNWPAAEFCPASVSSATTALGRVTASNPPLLRGRPLMEASGDSSQASRPPNLAEFKGLICVVHSRSIVIFNELLGIVEFIVGPTQASLDQIYKPYQTAEIKVDLHSLTAKHRARAVGIRVANASFDGFASLQVIDAVVSKVNHDQTVILRSLGNGDEILSAQSALPSTMAQFGDFLSVGKFLCVLVCDSGRTEQSADCKWRALRLFAQGHSAKIDDIRRLNHWYCEQNLSVAASAWRNADF